MGKDLDFIMCAHTTKIFKSLRTIWLGAVFFVGTPIVYLKKITSNICWNKLQAV